MPLSSYRLAKAIRINSENADVHFKALSKAFQIWYPSVVFQELLTTSSTHHHMPLGLSHTNTTAINTVQVTEMSYVNKYIVEGPELMNSLEHIREGLIILETQETCNCSVAVDVELSSFFRTWPPSPPALLVYSVQPASLFPVQLSEAPPLSRAALPPRSLH